MLRAQCYAPELKPERHGKDRRSLAIEEKETYRWVEGLRDCQALAHELPGTRLLCVLDREGVKPEGFADFFEVFDTWRNDPGVDLLVRAKHDRRTETELSLFEQVTQTRVRTSLQVEVQRLSARPKKGTRPARPPRPARRAHLLVRYTQVDLLPPNHGVNAAKEPVPWNPAGSTWNPAGLPVWLIQVREKDPPPGQERIEWFLLTTLEIDSPEQAVQCAQALLGLLKPCWACSSPAGLAVVLPALAYRRLAQGPQVGLSRRRRGPPNRGTAEANHCH